MRLPLVLVLLAALALPLLAQVGGIGSPAAPRAVAAVPRAGAAPAPREERARPVARPTEEVRCAPSGAPCIARATYAADVCEVIEAAAVAEGLDAGFFARLLWRESLFDPAAVSPAGAQGIAQFMPGTAALRGLSDPFNPAEAILASADYLRELRAEFGNLGLAAAAYNAGEERVGRYLLGTLRLPAETVAYVQAITGQPAEAWRAALDGAEVVADTTLDPEKPFAEACLAMADTRVAPDLMAQAPVLLPWAVILAAQGSAGAASAQAARLREAHGGILGAESIVEARQRVPGSALPRHTAQVGRATRGEADALCARLRAEGAACMVVAN